MSQVELIAAELKTLSPKQLEQAASYIRQLRHQVQLERSTILRSTSGILSEQEADEWMKAIEQYDS